ncbi:ATP-dependent nuclease [Pseudomonas sp. DR 5-09]|uniref:ATP-dependent nuclease n=1 Tax=Pseudomonas sp. DR 5-09 TaxID=1534110 RepID=UPI0007DCD4A3|nr:AAA family ATPase [Pseudomonas sp. DR 5-09]ANI56070.1 conjugative transposon DNA recombination protein [Pseudomonas sp. DR 5-09]
MHVKSLRLVNFKKFTDEHLEFNRDVNIFVGDNDAGKSTILEALEIVLNFSHRGRPFPGEFSPDLFNRDATEAFLKTNRASKHLPKLLIEAYIDGVPEYKGSNNDLGLDTQGVIVQAYFDPSLEEAYQEFLSTSSQMTAIPVEFYTTEWLDFSWQPIRHVSKKFRAQYIDPTRIHPTMGKNQYIGNILNAALAKEDYVKLTINYRENQQAFNKSAEVDAINQSLDSDKLVTDKTLSIAANTLPAGSIQTGLQLKVDEVPFHFIGKGEQSKVQIKLAIQNRPGDIDLVLIEEPENHLSHSNLNRLVRYIEDQRADKQLFLTTHSSYVLNKLSINKICLVQTKYQRLHELNPKVVKTLKRLPGYDSLRVALARNVILVEGPSDELVLKKIYQMKHGVLPEEHGIDIIVVRGVGFSTFIEIGKVIGTRVHVLRDNDGNYKRHVEPGKERYKDYANIRVFSSPVDEEFSLEPALIHANAKNLKTLNELAKTLLATKTFATYDEHTTLGERKEYLINWFRSVPGNGKGARKVDSAIRLFESKLKFNVPGFLEEVLDFG